ncbi:MAG: capsule assembly Wzi family protein, partial [Fibrobacterota bacterium]
FILGASCLFAEPPSVSVPLSCPVYSLIDQLTARTGMEPANLYTRPFSRKQVAAYLLKISNAVRKGTVTLNRVEMQGLDYYCGEFSIEGRLYEDRLPNREKHVYVFEDTVKKDLLTVDLGLKDSAAWRFSGGHGCMSAVFYGGIRGRMRDQLAFRSDVAVASELNTDKVYRMHNYDPVNGYPYNTFGDTALTNKKSWDFFESGLFLENRICAVELGVDRLRFGPAERNALTLSGETPPLGLLKLETQFWRFHYIHTINIIKGTRFRDKYMYAHRLEVALPQRFRLGLNEVVVYGDSTGDASPTNAGNRFGTRHFDALYSIPFIPYYFAQHYSGDRDNMALSLDAACHRIPNTKIYAELFLDDLISPLSFFDDYWSNKWAFTGGVHYYFPFAWPDLSLLMEYSRIEPWVYTHFFGESHRYRHYGQSLGSVIGPNADQFFMNARVAFQRTVVLDASFRNTRQDRGLRGDLITDTYVLGADPRTKMFLGGVVDGQRFAGLGLTLEPTRLLRLKFQYDQDLLNGGNAGVQTVVDINW